MGRRSRNKNKKGNKSQSDPKNKNRMDASTESTTGDSVHSLSSSLAKVAISQDLGARNVAETSSASEEESGSLPYIIVSEIPDPHPNFFRSVAPSECWIAARDLKQGETIFTDTEASLVIRQTPNPCRNPEWEIMSRKFPYSPSCRPNCRADSFHDGLDSKKQPKRGISTHELLAVRRGVVIIRALVPISKGEALTVARPGVYYPLVGTLMRLDCMREYSKFNCTCTHCADPTEGGSMFSAVPCQKCKKKNGVTGKMETAGYLLPVDPLDVKDDAVWKCRFGSESESGPGFGCGAVKSQIKCINFTWIAYESMQKGSWTRSDNCKFLEKIIATADDLEFHPNHWIVVMATHFLMRRQAAYILREIPVDKDNLPLENGIKKEQVEDLMTFIQRLQFLLVVRGKTSPGWTSQRGETLWMLWQAKFLIANRFKLQKMRGHQNQLKLALAQTKESLEILKECVTIRMFDYNPYETQNFSKLQELFQLKIKTVEKRIQMLELELEHFEHQQNSI